MYTMKMSILILASISALCFALETPQPTTIQNPLHAEELEQTEKQQVPTIEQQEELTLEQSDGGKQLSPQEEEAAKFACAVKY